MPIVMNWSDIALVRDGASKATPHVDLWRFIEEDLLQRGVPRIKSVLVVPIV